MRGVIWLFFLFAVAVSCLQEPDCLGTQNNIVGITFKTTESGVAVTQVIDTIIVHGFPELNSSTITASKITLPVNLFSGLTTYTIGIDNTSYLLILEYRSQSTFVSEDCGVRIDLSALEVYEHSFDSVSVINTTPGTDGEANNIEVFR
jgi:hypothetical protein